MQKPKSDRLFMPKRPPYEQAADYIISKTLTSTLPKKYEEGDNISGTTAKASNYFAKQKLRRANVLLRKKRESAMETSAELKEQWIELGKKEDELRQMFLNFNEFVVINNEKRMRATERLDDMIALRLTREEKINEMLEKCKFVQRVKDNMTVNIAQSKLYENYLRQFLQAYPMDFTNIMDILNRYETNQHTAQELIDKQELGVAYLSKIKHEFAKTIDRYVVTVTGLNTKVASLQERYEAARRECLKWEELYDSIRARATEQLIDIVSIKDCCWRIYSEICERNGKRAVFKDNYEKQLEVIKKALRDYKGINEMAREAEREWQYGSEKPRVSSETE